MKCPHCGLINPEMVMQCVCGYDLRAIQIADPYENYPKAADEARRADIARQEGRQNSSIHRSSPAVLPQVAGVLYLLFTIYAGLLAGLQLLLGLISTLAPEAFPLTQGAGYVIAMGVANFIGGIISFCIAIALFRRSRQGWKWGFTYAILSIPSALLTGLNCLNVPIALGFGVAAIVLWLARGEYGRPTTGDRPTGVLQPRITPKTAVS